MFAYVERSRSYLAYRGVLPRADPDASALDAVRLCVSPVDWATSRRWWVAVRTLLPMCRDARRAFAASAAGNLPASLRICSQLNGALVALRTGVQVDQQ